MIALDAGALVEKLTDGPVGASVEAVMEGVDRVCAPDLLYVEVASSLWRLVRAGRIDTGDAQDAIADLHDLPLTVLPHRDLLPRAWPLRESVRSPMRSISPALRGWTPSCSPPTRDSRTATTAYP